MFLSKIFWVSILLLVGIVGWKVFDAFQSRDYVQEGYAVIDLHCTEESVQIVIRFSSKHIYERSLAEDGFRSLKSSSAELISGSGKTWLVTWPLSDEAEYGKPVISYIGSYQEAGSKDLFGKITGIDPISIRAFGSENQVLLIGDQIQLCDIADDKRVTLPGTIKTCSLSQDRRHLLVWEGGLKVYSVPDFKDQKLLDMGEEVDKFRKVITKTAREKIFVTDDLSYLVIVPTEKGRDMSQQSIAHLFDIRSQTTSIYKLKGMWKANILDAQAENGELIWLVKSFFASNWYFYNAQGVKKQQIPVPDSKHKEPYPQWYEQEQHYLDTEQRRFWLARTDFNLKIESDQSFTVSVFRYDIETENAFNYELTVPIDLLVDGAN
ncbi:hypothetical protein Pla110_07860 [Polystyrenella longa]|uniref:Uncharacterized protein n=1 Tax=Polystyrenella longa TaxID=2528007 RepID=A0A518CIN2_9PLAN|nr:hypothetical protein [Polystyrenella longa]QDU79082.1 hypothetical protein Pla110_07860 [Polystyrenella longa]